MDRVNNFHRKRPVVLPPLPDLESYTSSLHPDLILTKNRLGSPVPKRNVIEPFEDNDNTNSRNPKIKVFEPCIKENEEYNLNFDLVSDTVGQRNIDISYETEEKDSFSLNERLRRRERENLKVKKLSEEHQETRKKKQKPPKIPSESFDILNSISKLPILEIPKRYPLLKPIVQNSIAN